MARHRHDDSGERRTAGLRIQLTPSERAELDRRARATGRSLSDFARIVLLSDLKAPAPQARDPEAIRTLAFEISKLETNLNQLAKIANERRAMPDSRTLEEPMGKIIMALEKVISL